MSNASEPAADLLLDACCPTWTCPDCGEPEDSCEHVRETCCLCGYELQKACVCVRCEACDCVEEDCGPVALVTSPDGYDKHLLCAECARAHRAAWREEAAEDDGGGDADEYHDDLVAARVAS